MSERSDSRLEEDSIFVFMPLEEGRSIDLSKPKGQAAEKAERLGYTPLLRGVPAEKVRETVRKYQSEGRRVVSASNPQQGAHTIYEMPSRGDQQSFDLRSKGIGANW